MVVGYFLRENGPKEWRCNECTDNDKKNRCCSLPQFKNKTSGRRLNFRLAGNRFLEVCPIGMIDGWAVTMWNEYLFAKEFGANLAMPEITHKAFLVIMDEYNKVNNYNIEKARKSGS